MVLSSIRVRVNHEGLDEEDRVVGLACVVVDSHLSTFQLGSPYE